MKKEYNIPIVASLIKALSVTIKNHNESSELIEVSTDWLKHIVWYGQSDNILDLLFEISEKNSLDIIKIIWYIYDSTNDDIKKDLKSIIKIEFEKFRYIETDTANNIKEYLKQLDKWDRTFHIHDTLERASNAFKEWNIDLFHKLSARALVLEGKNYGSFYFRESDFISDLPIEKIIRFNRGKLFYGSEYETTQWYQNRFCEYMFEKWGIEKDENWIECEEYIYGDREITWVKNLTIQINKKLKQLDCPYKFSCTDSKSIQLNRVKKT